MKIKDTAITLDMNKITLHSSSPRNVELPYIGELPADLEATAARIIFNVQAGSPPKVNLVTIRNGKKDIYPVEITAEEIKTILGDIGGSFRHGIQNPLVVLAFQFLSSKLYTRAPEFTNLSRVSMYDRRSSVVVYCKIYWRAV